MGKILHLFPGLDNVRAVMVTLLSKHFINEVGMDSLSAPKRTRREQAQARHDQILGAALSLFSHQGYAATSTKQIAQRVGITEGLLYHYFSTKLAILEEITQRTYTVASTMIT